MIHKRRRKGGGYRLLAGKLAEGEELYVSSSGKFSEANGARLTLGPDVTEGVFSRSEQLQALYRNEQRRLTAWVRHKQQHNRNAIAHWQPPERWLPHWVSYLVNDEGVFTARIGDEITMMAVVTTLLVVTFTLLACGGGIVAEDPENVLPTYRVAQYMLVVGMMFTEFAFLATATNYSSLCYGCATDADTWIYATCGTAWLATASEWCFMGGITMLCPAVTLLQFDLASYNDAYVLLGVTGCSIVFFFTARMIIRNYAHRGGLQQSATHLLMIQSLRQCYTEPTVPGQCWKLKAEWCKKLREQHGTVLEQWVGYGSEEYLKLPASEASKQIALVLEDPAGLPNSVSNSHSLY